MGLQQLQRNQRERALLTGFEAHRWGHAVLVGLQPARSADAPVITRPQPREAVLRRRGGEVIALGTGVREKALVDHAADGVASEIRPVGAAAAVAVPAGHRVTTAELQRFSQHVAGDIGGTVGLGHGGRGPNNGASLAKLWDKKPPGG